MATLRYTAEPAPASLGVGSGHWCVMLFETFVAGYWTDPDIARDYAWMMNAARAAAETSCPPPDDGRGDGLPDFGSEGTI